MEAVQRGDARAILALDVFVHRLSGAMGAMMASLGGVDAFVFTGGIGENVAQVRERACRQFEFLGTVPALAIHTEEDWEIARETRRVLG